jgi:hypothetical protein
MKFQMILAAIFAFAAVSTKKWHGNNNNQEANLCNKAYSDGAALAINAGFIGDANAGVYSAATNLNCVHQTQKNY